MRFFVSFFLASVFLFAASSTQSSIADDFESEYTQTKKADFDPLKGYNEFMTNVNDKFYTHLLFPVAKGYKKVVPKGARESVSNFFDNLFFPVRFINNLLQFKIKNAFEESQRFLINSTVGLAGLFDIAKKKFHIKAHNEDFGQTLGYYGFGGGFHIVWPILGDSNLRDSVGLVADSLLDPKVYIDNRGYDLVNSDAQSFGVNSFYIINRTSFEYKKYEAIKKGTVVLYPVLKELYEKRRDELIKE